MSHINFHIIARIINNLDNKLHKTRWCGSTQFEKIKANLWGLTQATDEEEGFAILGNILIKTKCDGWQLPKTTWPLTQSCKIKLFLKGCQEYLKPLSNHHHTDFNPLKKSDNAEMSVLQRILSFLFNSICNKTKSYSRNIYISLFQGKWRISFFFFSNQIRTLIKWYWLESQFFF